MRAVRLPALLDRDGRGRVVPVVRGDALSEQLANSVRHVGAGDSVRPVDRVAVDGALRAGGGGAGGDEVEAATEPGAAEPVAFRRGPGGSLGAGRPVGLV